MRMVVPVKSIAVLPAFVVPEKSSRWSPVSVSVAVPAFSVVGQVERRIGGQADPPGRSAVAERAEPRALGRPDRRGDRPTPMTSGGRPAGAVPAIVQPVPLAGVTVRSPQLISIETEPFVVRLS